MLALNNVNVYGIYSECIPICCFGWSRSYNIGYKVGHERGFSLGYDDGCQDASNSTIMP